MSAINYFINSANMFTPVLTITTGSISKFALEFYSSMLIFFSFFTTTLAAQTEKIITKINPYNNYTFEVTELQVIMIITILCSISVLVCDKIMYFFIYHTELAKKIKDMEKDIKKIKNDLELKDMKLEAFVKETESIQKSLNTQLYNTFRGYDAKIKKMNKEIKKYE